MGDNPSAIRLLPIQVTPSDDLPLSTGLVALHISTFCILLPLSIFFGFCISVILSDYRVPFIYCLCGAQYCPYWYGSVVDYGWVLLEISEILLSFDGCLWSCGRQSAVDLVRYGRVGFEASNVFGFSPEVLD